MRVAVVGAGVTGAQVVRLLSTARGVSHVALFEKAAQAGGRMQPVGGADAAAFLAVPADRAHKAVFDDLAAEGVLHGFDAEGLVNGLRPAAAKLKHYVSPNGLDVVAARLLDKAAELAAPEKLAVNFSTEVEGIEQQGDGQVLVRVGGKGVAFDAAVVTVPVPHLPDDGAVLSAARRQLDGIRYSTRYAWVADVRVGAARGNERWVAKYFPDGAVRYICRDDLKRDYELPGGLARVVAHSSVPYGLAAVRDGTSAEEVAAELRKEALAKLAFEAEVVSEPVLHLYDVFEGMPTAGRDKAFAVVGDTNVVLTGDAFASAERFSGCLEAAEQTAAWVVQQAEVHTHM